MGGTTSACNAKNILGLLIGLSFHKIPPWLGLRKVGNTIYNLVSDGTKFVPPFRNIDQPLQIDVKYVLDSYCILIIIFILKKMIFSASTIFFFLRHVLTHRSKTYLRCSILKCFNQVYESNERKTFLWTNAKLCRIEFVSFNCTYIKKTHILSIFYSLKAIILFKIKRVVLKLGVPIGIPWKKVQTWSLVMSFNCFLKLKYMGSLLYFNYNN